TLALHKPRGIVSTLDDPEGRPTLRPYGAAAGRRLYPVGRLDLNTSGVLLLTDDGKLAAALLHPRRGLARVYEAKVRGAPPQEAGGAPRRRPRARPRARSRWPPPSGGSPRRGRRRGVPPAGGGGRRGGRSCRGPRPRWRAPGRDARSRGRARTSS